MKVNLRTLSGWAESIHALDECMTLHPAGISQEQRIQIQNLLNHMQAICNLEILKNARAWWYDLYLDNFKVAVIEAEQGIWPYQYYLLGGPRDNEPQKVFADTQMLEFFLSRHYLGLAFPKRHRQLREFYQRIAQSPVPIDVKQHFSERALKLECNLLREI